MGTTIVEEWGVAHYINADGTPAEPVEVSDDKQDAEAWAQSQGGKVVRRAVTRIETEWEIIGDGV